MTTELAQQQSNVAAFDWWPDDKRAFPNALARSAVFTIGNPNEMRPKYSIKRPLKVAASSDMQIALSGEELREDDCDVYLQLIHMFRKLPANEVVQFIARDLIYQLGWPDKGDSYARLKDCIYRLAGALVVIEITRQHGNRKRKAGFGGTLLKSFKWLEEDGTTPLRYWQVALMPELVGLFAKDEHTWLDWDLRSKLKSALAKKLHYYYSSHNDQPFPLSIEYIWRLSGSSTGFSEFKRNVEIDLGKLVDQGKLDKKEANRVMASSASGFQEFLRTLTEGISGWNEQGIIGKAEASTILASSKAGLRQFKKALILALNELVDKKYLESYEISKTNILTVKKNPNFPQQGNLI